MKISIKTRCFEGTHTSYYWQRIDGNIIRSTPSFHIIQTENIPEGVCPREVSGLIEFKKRKDCVIVHGTHAVVEKVHTPDGAIHRIDVRIGSVVESFHAKYYRDKENMILAADKWAEKFKN